MNISKNQWIIIGIVGAVAVWYFFLRKKDDVKESGYGVHPVSRPTCPAGQCLCSDVPGRGWGCDSKGSVCCTSGEIVRPVGRATTMAK